VLIGFKKYTKIPANNQGGGHVDRMKVHFLKDFEKVKV
jgi:hypothetical protein